MTIGFFLFGRLGGCFWRETEETDEMTKKKKRAVWSPTSDAAPVGWNAGFLQKLWNQPPPLLLSSSLTPSSLRRFELGRMLSVTFQKCERRRGTVHLSETLVFSLYGETHPAEHITISARHKYWNQRVSSVSLCLSLAGPWGEIIFLNDVWGWPVLKLNAAVLFINNNHAASHRRSCFKVLWLRSIHLFKYTKNRN